MSFPIVLMYHDIVSLNDKSSGFQNESAFQYKVYDTDFEEQVKALREKNVVFTFDDGGYSFYTKAAPILEKYGKTGVFFISTKYIGTEGFLTDSQIQDLSKRGHIIGSHSHSHPHDFTKLANEDIRYEWGESNKILKRILGDGHLTASIPNGYSSKVVLEEAINCGYTDIYSSEPTRKVKSINNHNIIGRYVIHNGMKIDEILKIVDSKMVRRRIHIKWRLLELVKSILGEKYDKVKALILAR